MSKTLITDLEAAQRYEASVDGELAGYIEYVKYGRLALIHTEVPPGVRGTRSGQRARPVRDR